VQGDSETKICLEKPSAQRSLLLPDASGVIITNATVSDISSLVGLRGNRSLQFTGEAHAHSPQWKYAKNTLFGPVPPSPRIDCSAMKCHQHSGTVPRSTFEFQYASNAWYAVDMKVWREMRGVWTKKMPSYFSFVCPTDKGAQQAQRCDIFQGAEAGAAGGLKSSSLRKVAAESGVQFRRNDQDLPGGRPWQESDGFLVEVGRGGRGGGGTSKWPELEGLWELAHVRARLGLQWETAGTQTTIPTRGRELVLPSLSAALASAGATATSVMFTVEEWAALGVRDLRMDDFIKVVHHEGTSNAQTRYFGPAADQQHGYTAGSRSSLPLCVDRAEFCARIVD
jgi:hypothetical protein